MSKQLTDQEASYMNGYNNAINDMVLIMDTMIKGEIPSPTIGYSYRPVIKMDGEMSLNGLLRELKKVILMKMKTV